MLNKNSKGRYWAFIVYPESLPNNWLDIIVETGLPMAFSPLHDKDINPDGTIKKPHYHVLCYYGNTTTYNSVKENVSDKLCGSFPMKLETLRGMYRYHIHMDNPEKYQYKDSDRQFFNGFDVHRVGDLTYTEKLRVYKLVQQFIIDNDIMEYSTLLDLLLLNDMSDLYDIVTHNTILFNTYITSRRYKLEQDKKKGLSDFKKEVDK